VLVGAYQRGSDPHVDAALQHRGALLEFLRQRPDEATAYGDTYRALAQLGEQVGTAVRRPA
jgi:flagellar biosynthesis/type III secretory pathway ATPase